MVQDAAFVPVIATVGTEMTLHRPDLFLLPAQVRNLPTAQPAASGSLANAGSLSNLAPIHAALEASRGGPVLHGHVPLLLRTVADATISRVGRSRGAERQRRDRGHCDMEVFHGCISWLRTREPAFRARGKSLRESS